MKGIWPVKTSPSKPPGTIVNVNDSLKNAVGNPTCLHQKEG